MEKALEGLTQERWGKLPWKRQERVEAAVKGIVARLNDIRSAAATAPVKTTPAFKLVPKSNLI